MAPRYPFSRSKPSSSSTTLEPADAGPSYHAASPNTAERAVVVSATGRSPANLTAESPKTLRSRILSPREDQPPPSATKSAFQTDPSKYPSPTAHLLRGKTRKKGKGVDNGGGKGKWMELSGDSPTKEVSAGGSSKMAVPRYDSRGYRTKDGEGMLGESSRPLRSVSRGSVRSVSTAGAGVDEELTMYTRQFMTATPDRPSTYFAEGGGDTVAGASIYPPMSYSLSEHSRDPYEPTSYDPNPTGFGANNPYGQGTGNHAGPLPSLYGDSKVSLTSLRSEHSMTHFRKYDALQDSYGAFSISSKGGKRHLGEMVRTLAKGGASLTAADPFSCHCLQTLPCGPTTAQKQTTTSTTQTSSLRSR